MFAGMLGVTSFGLFLTPVFFVTIEACFSRRRAAHHPRAARELSAAEEEPGHA